MVGRASGMNDTDGAKLIAGKGKRPKLLQTARGCGASSKRSAQRQDIKAQGTPVLRLCHLRNTTAE
jgi:hypothetical protein